jgi:hypothetical protein
VKADLSRVDELSFATCARVMATGGGFVNAASSTSAEHRSNDDHDRIARLRAIEGGHSCAAAPSYGCPVLAGGRGRITGIPSTSRAENPLIALIVWATDHVLRDAGLTHRNTERERVIDSIRRECLDHVIVLNAAGLHQVLNAYITYYMQSRTHLALEKDGPILPPVMPSSVGRIVVTPYVGGLHHRYDRAAG